MLFAGFLIWVCLLRQVTCYCYDKNTDYKYINRDCGLTHVPSDIREEATDIDLSHNEHKLTRQRGISTFNTMH